jgi:hypothetical protein
MAVNSKIRFKRTSTSAGSLELDSGEPFVNLSDRRLFIGGATTSIGFTSDIVKMMTDGVWLNWNMTTEGGTVEEPLYIIYTKGALSCRLTLTWDDGDISSILYEFKEADSYAAVGTQTFSESNGRPEITWSDP